MLLSERLFLIREREKSRNFKIYVFNDMLFIKYVAMLDITVKFLPFNFQNY